MSKLLSSSSSPLRNRIHTLAPAGLRTGSADSAAPLLRALSSLTALNRSWTRCAFFCSDAKNGSEPASEADVKEVESGNESKSYSAIVSTSPRPEDYLTVLALSLPHRPLFPGLCMPIYVKHHRSETMSTTMLLKLKHSFPSSSRPLCTTPMSERLDVQAVSEIITNQHWLDLKAHHLKHSNPTEFLHRLLGSELDPLLISRYFTWSQKVLGVSHTLELTCRLLNSLATANKYPKIRSFLHKFVRESNKEQHSIFAIFHYLSVCSDRSRIGSVVADMLVLSYISNSKTQLGFEAFQRAGDYKFKLSLLSCNPLLCSLVKGNEIGKVEHVYKEMVKRRIRLDLYSFNIVINGLCKAGKLNKAMDVIQDMKAFGVSPNSVTYNTLIDGYCKMGRLGNMYKAEAALKEMVENEISPNEVTYNTLIDGFCRDENVPAARKMFDEMQRQGLKPNVVTYNSLINGFCSKGKVEEAFGLKGEMIGLGLEPNIVTYNALLNGLCKKKMLKEARELFDDFGDRGLVPNVVTYSTLIDSYCKNGTMDEAFRVLSLMLEKGVFPNTWTYNCLISGFCRSGNSEKAWELLDEMQSKGPPADLITYNILIRAFCDRGQTRDARKVLKDMTRAGLKPSHLTYNTLMEGFCREGNLNAALSVRAEMERGGNLRANAATYNVLIKGHCGKGKLGEANRLLNEMLEKGLVPNRTTYEIVREEMVEKGFAPDIDGHLCNIYG